MGGNFCNCGGADQSDATGGNPPQEENSEGRIIFLVCYGADFWDE